MRILFVPSYHFSRKSKFALPVIQSSNCYFYDVRFYLGYVASVQG